MAASAATSVLIALEGRLRKPRRDAGDEVLKQTWKKEVPDR
jgi:hypothetical protein